MDDLNKTGQKDVWDKIAQSWSANRQLGEGEIAKEVEKFAHGKKGRTLDVGCGNGRHLLFFRGELYGVDFSESMIEEARKIVGDKAQLFVANATRLPFESNYFDNIICAAVLHCLDLGERERALQEIKRVAKPGAHVLFSVWFKEENGDRFIAWNVEGKSYDRFYHFFSKEELEKELGLADLFIEESFISEGNQRNIFVFARA